MTEENAGAANGGEDAGRVKTVLGDSGGPIPPQHRHGLADFLVDRDIGCPDCGFTLRGLAGNRCPECGARIQLVIARPDVLWGVKRLLVATCTAYALLSTMSFGTHIWSLFRGPRMAFIFGAWQQLGSVALLLVASLGMGVALVRYWIDRRSQKRLGQLLVVLLTLLLLSSSWSIVAHVAWWLI